MMGKLLRQTTKWVKIVHKLGTSSVEISLRFLFKYFIINGCKISRYWMFEVIIERSPKPK